MLPIKEEQNKKYQEIVIKNGKYYTYEQITKEYAKWYATEIIKHCVEVAIVQNRQLDKGLLYNSYWEVDKQSILNVINEL